MAYVTLRRYTNLVAAIQMLRNRKITLLNPQLWDDRNDAYGMSLYAEMRDAKSVLALCFAEQHETYHHWKVFSPGVDGVCIEFDRDGLMESIDGKPGIRSGMVKYRQIQQLRAKPPAVEQLPFVKRFPYRDEKEFRIIFTDMKNELDFKDFDFDLGCIKRINLSPWTPKALSDSVKATIKSIDGCEALTLSRSTLVDNDQWKNCLRGAAC